MAIQGFGNAGAIAAQLFHEGGAKIIAVSDSQGGIYKQGGLEPGAVIQHKEQTGSVVDFPRAQSVSNPEIMTLPCDILLPAALENQIRADNVDAVQAKLVAELANGPTTPAADKNLFGRGIPVLPDILANAGGVTVSYFEWVQNIEYEQWDLDVVNRKLLVKMQRATDAVLESQHHINDSLKQIAAAHRERGTGNGPLTPVDLRTAAYVLAIRRVSEVTLARGIWP